MKYIRIISLLAVAVIFTLSAISKLQDMDTFEVYLYSLNLISFSWSAWIGRLLVSLELLIAMAFLFGYQLPFFRRLALSMISIFSIYLIYQIMQGSSENCFCFGELIEFSPVESFLKNILLALLILFSWRWIPVRSIWWKRSFWMFAIMALVAPPILSPPDMLVPGRASRAELDQALLLESIESNAIPNTYQQGKYVLCFYSTGCKYCRLSAQRIATSFRVQEIAFDALKIVFWGDDEQRIAEFLDNTNTPEVQYSSLNTKQYLAITKGRMPLILLIDDGVMVEAWNYRRIDERRFSDFLN